MSIDWKIVINCDISIHGISNIAEINLYVTNIEECLFSIVGEGEEAKHFLKCLEGYAPNYLFWLSLAIGKGIFLIFYPRELKRTTFQFFIYV